MQRVSFVFVAILVAVVTLFSDASGVASQVPAGLSVRLTSDGINSDNYPELRLSISVSDAAGRGPSDLKPADVSAPGAEIISVTESENDQMGTAYVIAIDASPSMAAEHSPGVTRLDLARTFARTYLTKLAPTDRVTVVALGGPAATNVVSGWVEPGNSLMDAGITGIQMSSDVNMGEALVGLTKLAAARPAQTDRAAIFLITDVDAVGKTVGPPIASISAQLGTPLFVASIRDDDALRDLELKTLFTSAAALTDGAFIGTKGHFESAIVQSRRTWDVVVSDGTRPDSQQNDLNLTVSTGGQSGTLTHHYRSGTLLQVTPLNVDGLDADAVITGDADLVASLVGPERWASTRVELFRDCDPEACRNVLGQAENSPLRYQLAASPLSQGGHDLVFRVSATDAEGRVFVDHLVIPFSREGTSYNIPFMVAMLGIAAAAIALTVVGARRKARPRRVGA